MAELTRGRKLKTLIHADTDETLNLIKIPWSRLRNKRVIYTKYKSAIGCIILQGIEAGTRLSGMIRKNLADKLSLFDMINPSQKCRTSQPGTNIKHNQIYSLAIKSDTKICKKKKKIIKFIQ